MARQNLRTFSCDSLKGQLSTTKGQDSLSIDIWLSAGLIIVHEITFALGQYGSTSLVLEFVSLGDIIILFARLGMFQGRKCCHFSIPSVRHRCVIKMQHWKATQSLISHWAWILWLSNGSDYKFGACARHSLQALDLPMAHPCIIWYLLPYKEEAL